MSEEKKDSWFITANEVWGHFVTFDEEVTQEQAMELYSQGVFNDILDSEIMSITSISEAE